MRVSPRILASILWVSLLAGCQADEAKLEAHLERGDGYLEEEQYGEAIIEYKNVLQIDPNHATAHWGLARAYLRNRQTREGFWELRETSRLDPTNLDAKLQFGQLSMYAGELEEVPSRQALDEQLVDRLADAVGKTELTPNCVSGVTNELNRDGVIQSELLSELLALLDGAFRPEHVVHRITDELEE